MWSAWACSERSGRRIRPEVLNPGPGSTHSHRLLAEGLNNVSVLYVVVGTIFSVVGLTLATEGVRTRIQEEDRVAYFVRRYMRSRMILLGIALLGLGVLLIVFWLSR